MSERSALIGLVALLLLAQGSALPVRAEQPNRAGLVIVFGDGTRLVHCVEFEGNAMAGSELLASSGLELNVDSTHGGGITVCKIEGTGCDFPMDACFCQCMGNGPCRYWNYFFRQPGQAEWVYSPLGALLHEVLPGSVEAWVWGDGHTPPELALTFDAVCGETRVRPLPTPEEEAETATPQPSLSQEWKAGETPSPSTRAGPVEATNPKPSLSLEEPEVRIAAESPQAGQGEGSALTPAVAGLGKGGAVGTLRDYWPLGVMLLLLAGVAAYLRAGRRA